MMRQQANHGCTQPLSNDCTTSVQITSLLQPPPAKEDQGMIIRSDDGEIDCSYAWNFDKLKPGGIELTLSGPNKLSK